MSKRAWDPISTPKARTGCTIPSIYFMSYTANWVRKLTARFLHCSILDFETSSYIFIIFQNEVDDNLKSNNKRCRFDEASGSTSRAARGGGGSFKNRKRIGEIGCCESRMTKRKH